MRNIRIGMAQINTTVGDLKGNAEKIQAYIEEAKEMGVDILAFPEMALTGYPPEDLLLKPQFIEDNIKYLHRIAEGVKEMIVIIGFVDSRDDIYNAAAVINNGRIRGVYHKMYLPNYGVFDEERYFQAGARPLIVDLDGTIIGVSICEDIWYPEGPALLEAIEGAEVIININASPFHVGKWRFREKMLATRASDNAVIVAYTNMVGGQDELIFDGHSMVFDEKGDLITRGKPFEEELVVTDLDIEAVFRGRLHDPRRRKERLTAGIGEGEITKINIPWHGEGQAKPSLPKREVRPLDDVEEVYSALVLGVRDYLKKNRFEKAVIGLSGGIDSALTAVVAVDALGKENVIGVFMPSPYTSRESKEDTDLLAKKLDIKLLTLPIDETFKAYLGILSKHFNGLAPNEAEENIQARIRGNLLMALSNKFGWLVLTTGNKSEMSVGYATLYGDTAGGFAVLKDVTKTLVYELSRYRNKKDGEAVIPERILTKAPSAELKPDQKDADTLPPYEILDPILKAYVEEDRSFHEIVSMGYDKETVKRVIRMVDKSEYKRRQAPPGIKITPRAFGKDRRMPITNRYESY